MQTITHSNQDCLNMQRMAKTCTIVCQMYYRIQQSSIARSGKFPLCKISLYCLGFDRYGHIDTNTIQIQSSYQTITA